MNPFAAEVLQYLSTAPGYRLTPRLKGLIEHEWMKPVWPLLERLEQGRDVESWAIARRFIAFACELPKAWAQLDKKATGRTIRKRIKDVRNACLKLDRLLGNYELDLRLWNNQLGTALSVHANIDQLFNRHGTALSTTQTHELLTRVARGDRSADTEAALRAVRQILKGMLAITDLDKPPLLVSIHPRKIGSETAERTFYIRALSWFLLATGKPHDRIVRATVSALIDEDVNMEDVRHGRVRLQAALKQAAQRR